MQIGNFTNSNTDSVCHVRLVNQDVEISIFEQSFSLIISMIRKLLANFQFNLETIHIDMTVLKSTRNAYVRMHY
jgi:hypothetical protein